MGTYLPTRTSSTAQMAHADAWNVVMRLHDDATRRTRRSCGNTKDGSASKTQRATENTTSDGESSTGNRSKNTTAAFMNRTEHGYASAPKSDERERRMLLAPSVLKTSRRALDRRAGVCYTIPALHRSARRHYVSHD